MNLFARARFESTLERLGVRPTRDVFPALETAYSEPDRHYHGTRHISECLAQFQNHLHLAVQPSEIEIALWFHDAIYDTRRSDNELRSADWAADFLRGERVVDDRVERVHAMIMATRHAAPVGDPDQRLLVDVDLGILGQPPPVFDAYDAAIRREYHWVPWPQYATARISVLTGFLDRPRIYSTAAFFDRYEAQARENIANAIEKLKRDPTATDRGNAHV